LTGAAVAVYAAVVVSDVAVSSRWYASTLSCTPEEHGEGWSCMLLPDHSAIELFAGDPAHPGRTFPSYAGREGPAVMPGYSVEDPEATVGGLAVARSLPDWHVVVAPDGLRIVVTHRDTDIVLGLVGFRYESPAVRAQRAFLDRLGVDDPVTSGPRPSVVPVVVGDSAQRLADPDGNVIELVTTDTLAARR
jgi:catechol 2,3-dioxygenase-like lactoylglutathione lyase family enzyme